MQWKVCLSEYGLLLLIEPEWLHIRRPTYWIKITGDITMAQYITNINVNYQELKGKQTERPLHNQISQFSTQRDEYV